MINSKKSNLLKNLIFLFFIVPIIFFSLHNHNHTNCEATKNKKLVIGIDINFPPMGFLDEKGNITGADVEFMKLACELMGFEAVFQPINWDAKEMELNSGRIDAICNGLTLTPERSKSMLLTESYMENGQVVVVRKDSQIQNLSQLKNKQLSVQQGSSGEEALDENSAIKSSLKSLVKLETCIGCLNEVKLNKVDGAVVDESVASYYLTKNNNSDELRILSEPLAKEQYVVAVKKGNNELKNKIEQAYRQMVNMEQTEQISKKWFGKQMFKFGSIQNQNDKTDNSSDSNKKNDTFAILSAGAWVTIQIFVFCLLFSMPLGLILCLIRRINFKPLNFIINFYIALMRGTPLLLQLFFVFYGLPIMFPGLILKNRLLVSIITFILNYAAYFSEIFRGGLNSIGIGQFENIRLLQIPKLKATCKIIVPQMLKVCLPSICNETITLVKDTPLSFAVGVIDFLTAAKNLVNVTADVSIYGIVALTYLITSSLIILIFDLIERKLKF